MTDVPNKNENGNLDGSGFGSISFISENVNSDGTENYTVVVQNAGFVDYTKGEIQLFTTNITSTYHPTKLSKFKHIHYPMMSLV